MLKLTYYLKRTTCIASYAIAMVGLLSACAWAQPLRIYSEFAKVNAKGQVTAPADPREILSPALARNAFASFQIVVDGPQGAEWLLYVAQNPENAVIATLYRENGDQLEAVTQPVSGSGVQVFWLDVWVDRNAAVRRIKVEPQLHLNNDWVIYPMEGRVVDAIVPDAGPNGKWPKGVSGPTEVMRGVVCAADAGNAKGTTGAGAVAGSPGIPARIFRNAQQDRALAGKAPKAELQQRFGACDAATSHDDATNPEAYYRVRDYLFRLP